MLPGMMILTSLGTGPPFSLKRDVIEVDNEALMISLIDIWFFFDRILISFIESDLEEVTLIFPERHSLFFVKKFESALVKKVLRAKAGSANKDKTLTMIAYSHVASSVLTKNF